MPGMWFELERNFAQDGITIGEIIFCVYRSLSQVIFAHPRPRQEGVVFRWRRSRTPGRFRVDG